MAYIKAEMVRQAIGFPELSRRFQAAGGSLDRVGMANKVNRGTFGAGFFLLVLELLGCPQVPLSDIAQVPQPPEGG